MIGCVLCLCAFKMHNFALSFFEISGRTMQPRLSRFGLQQKLSKVVFSNLIYFAIFFQCSVSENLNQVYIL